MVPGRRRARWLDAPFGQSGSAGVEPERVCQQRRLCQEEGRLLQGQGQGVPLRAAAGIKWFLDEDERDGWTHRLANLVPLERNKNASASNDDCAKKKDAYFRGKGKVSPFVLPQEVRSENAWTPTLLAECQQCLVGVLKDHWNLAVATGTAAS
ncbi:HNH endonuclease family protein [Xylella fastidiosa subsp. sandyi]|uniref:HNH endonuclease family protein n=1 Tax=Xylella fastidiosa TaxID=2371 RepID=UPI001F4E924F|nr:HNH endonuclease family protein [Xylella fastidiosa]